MIFDDMGDLKTLEEKYKYLDNLGSKSLRNKLKEYSEEYDKECSLEILSRIELICKILKERILE